LLFHARLLPRAVPVVFRARHCSRRRADANNGQAPRPRIRG
jgi:hypothetical protein